MAFLNKVLNTLIRDLPSSVRIIISVVIFLLAVFSFMASIRLKNDKAPISVGWLILCILCLFISSLYMFL